MSEPYDVTRPGDAQHCCDHCGWLGGAEEILTPRDYEGVVCPACWEAGWVASPREKLGSLYEAMVERAVVPRVPKRLIDMTEDELEDKVREARARMAHERATVYVPTTTNAGRQAGFGFMREEFRVKGKNK